MSSATKTFTLDKVTTALATTATVTGTNKVIVTDHDFAAKAAITSTNSAGVTFSEELGATQTFAGGAGADTISLGASTVAHTTGAGNDKVTLSAAKLGTGGTVDAGEGTDTIVMTGANAATATATAAFEATVSNFETLQVTTPASVTINLANLDNINSVSTATSTAAVITNYTTGGTLTLTGASTKITPTLVAAATVATDDVFNIVVSNAASTDVKNITLANVETVNINTNDSALVATGVQHTVDLDASAAKTLTVTGDAGFVLPAGTTSTALTTIDTSGITKGAVSVTSAGTGSLTVTAGATANTINTTSVTSATKTVSVTTGAGADGITTGGSNDTIVAGNGANTIVTGNGTNSVTGGTGVDTVTGGTGVDTISTGAGNDVIAGGAGLDQITTGAGADKVTVVANTNGNIFATITDATSTDIIAFADKGTETFTAAKVTLGGTAVFQDYLNAAAAGDGSTNGIISWFQFNGNTYVTQDISNGATFVNAADFVVELTGLIDLSKATLGDFQITLA